MGRLAFFARQDFIARLALRLLWSVGGDIFLRPVLHRVKYAPRGIIGKVLKLIILLTFWGGVSVK